MYDQTNIHTSPAGARVTAIAVPEDLYQHRLDAAALYLTRDAYDALGFDLDPSTALQSLVDLIRHAAYAIRERGSEWSMPIGHPLGGLPFAAERRADGSVTLGFAGALRTPAIERAIAAIAA